MALSSRPLISRTNETLIDFARQQMKKLSEIKAEYDELKPQFPTLKAEILVLFQKIMTVLKKPEEIRDSINICEAKTNRCAEIANSLRHLLREAANIALAAGDKLKDERAALAVLEENYKLITNLIIAKTVENISSIEFFEKNPGAKAIALALLKPLDQQLEKREISPTEYQKRAGNIVEKAVKLFISQTPSSSIVVPDDLNGSEAAPKSKIVIAEAKDIQVQVVEQLDRATVTILDNCIKVGAETSQAIEAYLKQQKVDELIATFRKSIVTARANVARVEQKLEAEKAAATSLAEKQRSATMAPPSERPLASIDTNTQPAPVRIFSQSIPTKNPTPPSPPQIIRVPGMTVAG